MKTNAKNENYKGNKKSASFCQFVDQYVSIININNITIIVIIITDDNNNSAVNYNRGGKNDEKWKESQ